MTVCGKTLFVFSGPSIEKFWIPVIRENVYDTYTCGKQSQVLNKNTKLVLMAVSKYCEIVRLIVYYMFIVCLEYGSTGN